MWNEAKLGCLLLLGSLRMLKTWYAWTLIMIFWYLLEMAWGLHLEGLNLTYGLLVFAWMAWPYTSCMHLVSFWPLMFLMFWWAQVLGVDSFKKQIGLPFQVEFNHRFLSLSSFIAYKVQTIMMGSSVGLESSWFKQRPNKCVMQCNLHGPT